MPYAGLNASVSVPVFFLKYANVNIMKNLVSGVKKSQRPPDASGKGSNL